MLPSHNTIQHNKHIYFFRYDTTESMLCKLESRYLFNEEDEHKHLITHVTIDPSRSAFIKKRLDVIALATDFGMLIDLIKAKEISTDGFKVEYLILAGDSARNAERLSKLRDVGFCIDTYPDYHHPTITYGICTYAGVWYFGVIVKNNFIWEHHRQKPHTYSNSIKQNIAKALVNIAVNSKQDVTLLDACCGAGTIMLEACFAGYEIDGCDISWKISNNARANLSHFNYDGEVYFSDIKDITQRYDAAIIDLPYNIYSQASESDVLHIIRSTSAITDRIVIVSTVAIEDSIRSAGLRVVDYCTVPKRGKAKFTRRIWVCESVKDYQSCQDPTSNPKM